MHKTHKLLHELDMVRGTPSVHEVTKTVFKNFPNRNMGQIVKTISNAFTFSEKSHKDQYRKQINPVTKNPYDFVIHPFQVASILANAKHDEITVAGGALHDTIDNCGDINSFRDIYKLFGPQIAIIVDGMTGYDAYIKYKQKPTQFQKRKQKAAISKDFVSDILREPRILPVKLADRINNLMTITEYNQEQQKRILLETIMNLVPLGQISDTILSNELIKIINDVDLELHAPENILDIQRTIAVLEGYAHTRKHNFRMITEKTRFDILTDNLELLIDQSNMHIADTLLQEGIKYIAYHLREGNEPLTAKLPNMPTTFIEHPLEEICAKAIRGSGEKAMYELFGKHIEEFIQEFDKIILNQSLRRMTMQEAIYFKATFQFISVHNRIHNTNEILEQYFKPTSKNGDLSLSLGDFDQRTGLELPNQYKFTASNIVETVMEDRIRTYYFEIPKTTDLAEVDKFANSGNQKPLFIQEITFADNVDGYRIVYDAANLASAYDNNKFNKEKVRKQFSELAAKGEEAFAFPFLSVELKKKRI